MRRTRGGCHKGEEQWDDLVLLGGGGGGGMEHSRRWGRKAGNMRGRVIRGMWFMQDMCKETGGVRQQKVSD